MNKLSLRLSLLLCTVLWYSLSYCQTGYVGLIYDNANFPYVRPYAMSTLEEKKLLGKVDYAPVIGVGMNSLGNISIQVGFDLYRPLSRNIRAVMGCGVEVIGWVDVYKEFLPSIRLGIEVNHLMFLMTTNYTFNEVYKLGVKGYEPVMRPTLGIFYRFK